MGQLEDPVTLQAAVRQEQDGTAICQVNFSRKGIEIDDSRSETYRFEPRAEIVELPAAGRFGNRKPGARLLEEDRITRENWKQACETVLASGESQTT